MIMDAEVGSARIELNSTLTLSLFPYKSIRNR